MEVGAGGAPGLFCRAATPLRRELSSAEPGSRARRSWLPSRGPYLLAKSAGLPKFQVTPHHPARILSLIPTWYRRLPALCPDSRAPQFTATPIPEVLRVLEALMRLGVPATTSMCTHRGRLHDSSFPCVRCRCS